MTRRCVRQLAWFCPCGATVRHGGRCLRCYARRQHSLRKFAGGREKVLERDGYRCLGCGTDLILVVHHRSPEAQTTRRLATLCRRCHPRIHKTLRHRFGRMTAFLRSLWREQHPGMPEQLELPLDPLAVSMVAGPDPEESAKEQALLFA